MRLMSYLELNGEEAAGGEGEEAGAAGAGKKKAKAAAAAAATGGDATALSPSASSSSGATTAPTALAAAGSGGILKPLCEKIKQVITAGVGLPSRGAAARFISSLVYNLTDSMKPQAMLLMRCLQGCLEDPSPGLRQEFCTSAAALARICKTGTLGKYIERLLGLATAAGAGGSGSGDRPELRLTAGQGFKELFKQAGERAKAHLAEVAPVCFLGSFDSDASSRAMWAEAWAEMAPSPKATLQLYASEMAAAVQASLDSSAWEAKRQGALALSGLIQALTEASDFSSAGTGVAGAGEGGATSDAAATSLIHAAAAVSAAAGASSAIAGIAGFNLPLLQLAALPLPVHGGKGTSKEKDGGSGSDRTAAHPDLLLLQRRKLLQGQCLALMPHAPALLQKLLAGISAGRVWEGKEALLEAMGLLVSRCAGAVLAAGEAVGMVGAATGAAAAPPTLSSCVKLLLLQAQRSSSPMPYVLAAVRAAILILLTAQPSSTAAAEEAQGAVFTAVHETMLGVLGSRCSRGAVVEAVAGKPPAGLTSPSATAAGGTSAAAGGGGAAESKSESGSSTAAPSTSSSLRGGVVNEAKEGEQRAAAKEKELQESLLATACFACLAAAVPSAAAAVSGGAGAETRATVEGEREQEGAAGKNTTASAVDSTLHLFAAMLQSSSSQLQERVSLFRAVGLVLSRAAWSNIAAAAGAPLSPGMSAALQYLVGSRGGLAAASHSVPQPERQASAQAVALLLQTLLLWQGAGSGAGAGGAALQDILQAVKATVKLPTACPVPLQEKALLLQLLERLY